MTYKVAAFYQFASLPDYRELREPLRAVCAGLKLKGSVLLAHEGINGTLAGEPAAIADFVAELRDGAIFGGRLDHLELKFSQASAIPFQFETVQPAAKNGAIAQFGNEVGDRGGLSGQG